MRPVWWDASGWSSIAGMLAHPPAAIHVMPQTVDTIFCRVQLLPRSVAGSSWPRPTSRFATRLMHGSSTTFVHVISSAKHLNTAKPAAGRLPRMPSWLASSALLPTYHHHDVLMLHSSTPRTQLETDWGAAAPTSQVASALPKCIDLAAAIVAAGERVVANNARCSQLVSRITAMQPLLVKLQAGGGPRCAGSLPAMEVCCVTTHKRSSHNKQLTGTPHKHRPTSTAHNAQLTSARSVLLAPGEDHAAAMPLSY
jgi:hypothetical protein